MYRAMRGLLLVGGVFGMVLAVLYYSQSPLIRTIWPWSGGYGNLSPLSNIFIASIAASTSAPNLWVALTGEMAALRAGAINLIITFFGVCIFLFQSYTASPNNPRLLVGAVVCAVYLLASIAIFLWSRRIPFRATRRTPALVRASFVGFVVALLLVGGALVLKMPNIFPWTLRGEVSIVYGWIFLGAAAYFADGVLRPYWSNASGQLLGFLFYDLVLIVPFLQYFDDVRPANRLSLIIYLSVLIYSGLLAIYYLFINPATRLWRANREMVVRPA